jgi:hypothetical protein
MDEISKVEALLTLARKYKYRVGSIYVGADSVRMYELVPLAPDVEEEIDLDKDADRRRQAEKNREDRRLLNL